MKSIFSDHMNLTAKVMDLRMERQNVVMSNLANIRTPGYRARRYEFEKALQDAVSPESPMSKTQDGHIPAEIDTDNFKGDIFSKFKVYTVRGEDSVDLDKEMNIMAKNALQYKALETIIKKSLDGVKTAITEGGK